VRAGPWWARSLYRAGAAEVARRPDGPIDAPIRTKLSGTYFSIPIEEPDVHRLRVEELEGVREYGPPARPPSRVAVPQADRGVGVAVRRYSGRPPLVPKAARYRYRRIAIAEPPTRRATAFGGSRCWLLSAGPAGPDSEVKGRLTLRDATTPVVASCVLARCWFGPVGAPANRPCRARLRSVSRMARAGIEPATPRFSVVGPRGREGPGQSRKSADSG